MNLNTTQNSSDNFPSSPPDKYHCQMLSIGEKETTSQSYIIPPTARLSPHKQRSPRQNGFSKSITATEKRNQIKDTVTMQKQTVSFTVQTTIRQQLLRQAIKHGSVLQTVWFWCIIAVQKQWQAAGDYTGSR